MPMIKYQQKIKIHEHILSILTIYFINKLAKTIKYKDSFNSHISQTVSSIWVKFYNQVQFAFLSATNLFNSCQGNFILSFIPSYNLFTTQSTQINNFESGPTKSLSFRYDKQKKRHAHHNLLDFQFPEALKKKITTTY